jgi:hypothetical protein
MTQSLDGAAAEASEQTIKVDDHVRVYPDTPHEVDGYVVEDFDGFSGEAVDIGEHHIVDAARRWAVRLADDTLVFVDDADLASVD